MASIVQFQHAFQPDSDLWAFSSRTPKSFIAKLDWYLNFQISKSSRHQKQKRSQTIDQIISQTELNLPQLHAEAATPLFLSVRELLPCRWIALYPQTDCTAWLAAVQMTWLHIGKPNLKLFVPEGEDPQNVFNLWKPHDPVESFTVVHWGNNI